MRFAPRGGSKLSPWASLLLLASSPFAPTLIASSPVNDYFENRIVLTGTSVVVSGTMLDATVEAGEPPHLYDHLTKSVWYSWAPPFSGSAQLTAVGTYVG